MLKAAALEKRDPWRAVFDEACARLKQHPCLWAVLIGVERTPSGELYPNIEERFGGLPAQPPTDARSEQLRGRVRKMLQRAYHPATPEPEAKQALANAERTMKQHQIPLGLRPASMRASGGPLGLRPAITRVP